MVDTKKLKINNNFLYSFFKILSVKEQNRLTRIQKKRNNFKLKYKTYKSEFEKQIDIINHSPITHNFEERKVDFSKKTWDTTYYKHCLDIEEPEEINSICYNYCEGLKWTFMYYFNECISFDWKYNFVHPPLIKDICEFLLENDINKIKFQKGKPNHIIVQLLSIMPKESCYLLPEKYHQLMSSGSQLDIYYPRKYKLDTFFKRYEWMCVPILPVLDLKKINKIFRKINMDEKTRTFIEIKL
jgi:5''-3'' exonuclease